MDSKFTVLSRIDQIYDILQKQIGYHRQLLDLVRAERDALLTADLKAIQDCTYSKEALIEAVRTAEDARHRIVMDLAMIWKKPIKELSLQQIILIAQGENLAKSDQLRSAFTTLTIMIERIREQNLANSRIVERSMEHISAMKKNVLGESSPKAQTYGTSGQRVAPSPGARLISKEV